MFATLSLMKWLPAGLSLVISLIAINIAFRVLYRSNRKQNDGSWLRQITFFAIVVFCLISTIILLPISFQTRGQIFNLLGIAITGVVALSSATFVGNLMSALMLKAINSIRLGDFLKVGDHFGRVTERGLLHTEIQTEERTLTTLPNLFLITNPYTVVRSTGTVITCNVSLGYDVNRHDIEAALLKAAEKSGLKDPYVHILDLGDYSVSYKVAGLLDRVKFLLSARSDLRAHVLDELHKSQIEIVSPSFMNQRPLDKTQVFIPKLKINKSASKAVSTNKKPEDLIFDKAEDAQSKEALKTLIKKIETMEIEINSKLGSSDLSDEEKEKLNKRLSDINQRKTKIEESLLKFD